MMTWPRASRSGSCASPASTRRPSLSTLPSATFLALLPSATRYTAAPTRTSRLPTRAVGAAPRRIDCTATAKPSAAVGVSSQSPNRTSTRTMAPPFDWYWTSTSRARPAARSTSAAVSLLPDPSGSVASAARSFATAAACPRRCAPGRDRSTLGMRRSAAAPPVAAIVPASQSTAAPASVCFSASPRSARAAPDDASATTATIAAARELLPLDRRGGLRRDVIDHSVDAFDLVDDSRRDGGQQVVGQRHPVGGHAVLGVHRAQHGAARARHLTQHAHRQARSGERLSPQHVARQADLGAQRAHLVLEQLAQRLDQLQVHP